MLCPDFFINKLYLLGSDLGIEVVENIVSIISPHFRDVTDTEPIFKLSRLIVPQWNQTYSKAVLAD
jgi:hypothetical protein